jgi:guanylate kinase
VSTAGEIGWHRLGTVVSATGSSAPPRRREAYHPWRREAVVVGSGGALYIVSSPSGGGKTTLIRRVMDELASEGREVYFSISHTTRVPRPGEHDGIDYYFVDRPTFESMVTRNEFLEYAWVHGNFYGTSRAEVEIRLARGCDVFLDIDVQGARQVHGSVGDAVKVFIMPPSYAELRRRLEARRQDDPEAIGLRLRNALKEMREYEDFDYVIINDRLDEAVRALRTVVVAAGFHPPLIRGKVAAIIEDFERVSEEA